MSVREVECHAFLSGLKLWFVVKMFLDQNLLGLGGLARLVTGGRRIALALRIL
jgi:hypothetical protein